MTIIKWNKLNTLCKDVFKRRQGYSNLEWISHLKKRKGPKQKSQAWLEARKGRLTCSDIAAVINWNPYSSPTNVIMKKLGRIQFKGNRATEHGNRYEDIAIQKYAEKYGKKVVPIDFGLQQHPNFDWLAGSPDGITEDCILLEVKCPLRRKIKPGEIPKYYVPQVLVLMEIFDLEKAHYIEFIPGNLNRDEQLHVLEIERNQSWFQSMLPNMFNFILQLRMLKRADDINVSLPPLPPTETPKKKIITNKEKEFRTYRFVKE